MRRYWYRNELLGTAQRQKSGSDRWPAVRYLAALLAVKGLLFRCSAGVQHSIATKKLKMKNAVAFIKIPWSVNLAPFTALAKRRGASYIGSSQRILRPSWRDNSCKAERFRRLCKASCGHSWTVESWRMAFCEFTAMLADKIELSRSPVRVAAFVPLAAAAGWQILQHIWWIACCQRFQSGSGCSPSLSPCATASLTTRGW